MVFWKRPSQPAALPNHDTYQWFGGGEFKHDWVTGNLATWIRVLEPIREACGDVLEIGSYDGRSASFFLNYFPNARVTCIDPFIDKAEAEKRFDANVAAYGERVRKLKGRSLPKLEELIVARETFDLVYIDGDHRRDAVLADSLLAWNMLKPGGFVIWDDYLWKRWRRRAHRRPKQAIDTFVDDLYRSRLTVLHRGYQVIARRNSAEQPE